jgi:hypothetical protein
MDRGMNCILIAHSSLAISKITRKMVKGAFNGPMDKFTMDNGLTIKSTEVVSGKLRGKYLM